MLVYSLSLGTVSVLYRGQIPCLHLTNNFDTRLIEGRRTLVGLEEIQY